jgi:regulator of cell morphogenesis and NO signaling
MFDRNQTVANLVLDHSECAEVLQRHHIDFCCRGDMSVEAAARYRKVDVDALVQELSSAIDARRGRQEGDPRSLSTPRLVRHIVSKHHEYLRSALPFIEALATKVSRVHGGHNPKLRDLADAVHELHESLIAHLDDEERVLFPVLTAEQPDLTHAARLVAAMTADHLEVANLLDRIRAATDEFVLPTWACNSYRTLFSELEQLEADTFQHIHLENNVLEPRFAAPIEPGSTQN